MYCSFSRAKLTFLEASSIHYAPKVLNSRICLLTYTFSNGFKAEKLYGSPGRMCCLTGPVWVCSLHLSTLLWRQHSLLCGRERSLQTLARLRFMQCSVLILLCLQPFQRMWMADVQDYPAHIHSRLQNEEKLRLCQDIAERCSGLHKSGSSSAEACVYAQTWRASA